MASVAAAGVFNAIAFARASYLFKMIDKGGYEKELRRHKRAMEKLSAAKEKWYENEVEKKKRTKPWTHYEELRTKTIHSQGNLTYQTTTTHPMR